MHQLRSSFLVACLFAGVSGWASAQTSAPTPSESSSNAQVKIRNGGYASSSVVMPADQDAYETKRAIIRMAEDKKAARRQADADMVRRAGNTPIPVVVQSGH